MTHATQPNPQGFAIRWNQRTAAEYLGVSPRTLEAWRLQGKGPVYLKLGRAIRYDKTHLDAWTEGQTRHSTSEENAA